MTYSVTLNFADAEVPTVAGNQLITQHAPSPAESLQLYRNGILQTAGLDYVVNGYFILPTPRPDVGIDRFVCWYRY